MKSIAFVRQAFMTLSCGLLLGLGVQAQPVKEILNGSSLEKGFDMGLDTDTKQRTWMTKESDAFKLVFPSRQEWAAVFITVGKPKPEGARTATIDLSAYKFLSIDMKGLTGTEMIEVGIKSNTQPDNGTEVKLPYRLSPEWKTYKIPLEKFVGGSLKDLKSIYVVTEFVYLGDTAQTIYFKNIKYLDK